MSLKLCKTMWGVPESEEKGEGRKAMFKKVVDAGFKAVELHIVVWRLEGIVEDVQEAGLEWVGQVHTAANVDGLIKDKGILHTMSWEVADHLTSLKTLASEAKKLGAIAVNSHSGVDGWSIDQAREYLRGALAIEKELGIEIFHETHRRRLFWNPFQTRDILAGQEDLADVKLNADISHWVVALERTFGLAESSFGVTADPWFDEVMDLLRKHCCMIHARVGYAEGPQVADPAAPEYEGELKAHMFYWEQITKAQIAKGRVSIIEPEHGPWPYQQSVPNTNMAPTHDIWEANDFVKEQIREAYPKWAAEVTK